MRTKGLKEVLRWFITNDLDNLIGEKALSGRIPAVQWGQALLPLCTPAAASAAASAAVSISAAAAVASTSVYALGYLNAAPVWHRSDCCTSLASV